MVQDGKLLFDAEPIRRQLDRVISSSIFSAAKRSRMFLRYIVEQTLLGSPPKEFEIAAEVLGRGADYDPGIDATVRVEASRLRYRLREYYDTVGKNDPVLIDIPKGAYRAVFVWGTANPATVELAAPRVSPTAATVRRSALLSRLGEKSKWWTGAVAAAAVLASILVLVSSWKTRQQQQTAGPIHSLAVLPLKNLSGNAREEYFVDGMTDALITELAHTPNLRVVSRTSIMQEKGDKKTLQQIASALGVEAVIEGSVVRWKDRIRITAQLIDTRDDRHLWAQSYQEQMSDILMLQDKVARDIALQTRSVLAPGRESVRSRRINPGAYDAYLRGLYFLNQRDVSKSVNYFEQATAVDPSYAPAYAGLAEALLAKSVGGNARFEEQSAALTAAKRAVQLDPKSGEAYAALGFAEMVYQKDWTAAGNDMEKGLGMNPNDSLAEMQYSIYLDAMARPEEAVSHMKRALQLDPRSFLMNRHLGATLYFAHRYEEALGYLQRAEDIEPTRFGYVEAWKARCYEMESRFDDAVRADLRDLNGTIPDGRLKPLREAYRRGGWKEYQRARIDLIGKQPSEGCDLYEVGESYLRIGDRNPALSWLGRGAEAQCFWADALPVDPVLDSIRSDSRFAELLQIARLRSGLKAAAN